MRQPYLLTLAILLATTRITEPRLNSQQAQANSKKLYWIEEISADGRATLHIYENTSTKYESLSGIDVWPQKIATRDPMTELFWEEPDIGYELLRKGYGRLKNEHDASPKHQKAQREAAAEGRGLWRSKDGNSTEPIDPISPEMTIFPLNAERIIYWISAWGGVSAVIATLVLIGRFLIHLYRRKRLPLVFLGAHSAGKSWLWARIKDDNISLEQLEAIDRTDVTNRAPALQPKLMGKYEVTPTYIDTPGGQPGWQVTEMLGRRWWLKPRKMVWTILLSTTPLKTITRESPEDQKIDHRYIAEQLGYLMLPLGILASPRAPKPNLVIMIISKFDLFADRDNSPTAKEQLEAVFKDHIERVKGECARAEIPFELEFCSAREGWRTLKIHTHIEKAIFAR